MFKKTKYTNIYRRNMIVTVLVIIITALFLLYKTKKQLSQFFILPPRNWIFKINKSLDKFPQKTNKDLIVDFGWKNGSVRKQLILASNDPSQYSNKKLDNTFYIAETDRKVRQHFSERLNPKLRGDRRIIHGFFHPNCNAGGGGEKVLWKAVECTLKKDKNSIVVIYTGDTESTNEQILNNVFSRFNYSLDKGRIVFIYLKNRYLVDSKTWNSFTLIGQAFGSILLCLEALYKCPSDVWYDTMGYPFTYPFVRWLACVPIITYTHYPLISSDMLNKLKLTPGFNKSVKLRLKYIYWKLFMTLYAFCGSFIDIPITNSTWTNNHIKSIWTHKEPKIIYPPCSTENLIFDEPPSSWVRKNQAIVIAQFRPEKRHEIILKSFKSFISEIPEDDKVKIPKLIMIGSTRSEKDREFVNSLKTLAYEKLLIPKEFIEFQQDCKYDIIKNYLRESTFGINAMWNEHFGIAVVEYIASGLIPLVHASAGPLLDIVVPWDTDKGEQCHKMNTSNRTGFFFKDISDPDYNQHDEKEYSSLSELFVTVANLSNEEKLSISQRGKACVLNKFSDTTFHRMWDEILNKIEQIKKYSQD